MRIFRMLGRSIRDAFKSVIRNFSLSLASISCITITLIIVAIAIMASFNVQNFTKEIEKDLTIVIFLNNDVTEEDVTSVEQRLKKINYLKKDYLIAFEIGYKQAKKIDLLAHQYLDCSVTIEKDLYGKDRYVFIKNSN